MQVISNIALQTYYFISETVSAVSRGLSFCLSSIRDAGQWGLNAAPQIERAAVAILQPIAPIANSAMQALNALSRYFSSTETLLLQAIEQERTEEAIALINEAHISDDVREAALRSAVSHDNIPVVCYLIPQEGLDEALRQELMGLARARSRQMYVNIALRSLRSDQERGQFLYELGEIQEDMYNLGVQLGITDFYKSSLINRAIEQDHLEIVELLLPNNPPVELNRLRTSALYSAIRYNKIDIFLLLVPKEGVPVEVRAGLLTTPMSNQMYFAVFVSTLRSNQERGLSLLGSKDIALPSVFASMCAAANIQGIDSKSRFELLKFSIENNRMEIFNAVFSFDEPQFAAIQKDLVITAYHNSCIWALQFLTIRCPLKVVELEIVMQWANEKQNVGLMALAASKYDFKSAPHFKIHINYAAHHGNIDALNVLLPEDRTTTDELIDHLEANLPSILEKPALGFFIGRLSAVELNDVQKERVKGLLLPHGLLVQ